MTVTSEWVRGSAGMRGVDCDLNRLLLCRGLETLAAEKVAFEEEKKAHTELYETQQQVRGQFLVTEYESHTHTHIITHHTFS